MVPSLGIDLESTSIFLKWIWVLQVLVPQKFELTTTIDSNVWLVGWLSVCYMVPWIGHWSKCHTFFVVIQQICVTGTALLSKDILASQTPFDKVY